ncbi:MAG: alpha/beta fold hydrolase [Actinomycetota bacterium]
MIDATLPPPGLPGLDTGWSRLITASDADGEQRTWHVLDTGTDADGATAGTILCVHGNPTWSYAFRDVLAAPPTGWRVIAVDHLDMGFSERTGTQRRLARRIDDLGRLTVALELDGPVVLLAHDWGGPIALGWALAHREQVAGVVLTNTAVHQPEDAPAPRLIRSARVPAMLDSVTVRTPTFLRGATALARPPLPVAVIDAYAAPYTNAERRAAIGGFVRDIPLEEGHPSASSLDAIADGLDELADVPCLLLWGARDPVFSERYLHDLEARLPHADVHRVEDAGHLTPEDIDLAAALRRWLPARIGPGRTGGAKAATQGDADAATHAATQGDADAATHDETEAETEAETEPETEAESETADGATRTPLWAALADPARGATDAIVEPVTDGGGEATEVRRVSFAALAADVHALAVGLHAHGVQPGDRVASLVTPGRELATLLYACWRLGAVVVVADAGLGAKGLSRALRSAAPAHLVGVPRALAAAAALRWPGRRIAAGDPPRALRRGADVEASLEQLLEQGRRLVARGPGPLLHGQDLIATGADPRSGSGADALLPPPPPADAEAAIAFTSGSTGPAKGVVYRHRQLEAQRDALRRTYAITDQDRLVAAFAPFALYGPALGITSMVPDMDVTAPASLTATSLAEAVAAVGATLVFASPAALTNVARTAVTLRGEHRSALAGVRTLLSAGAPVPASLLRRLAAVVPNAAAHTPYGMTECLPVADIDLATIEAVGPGNGVCVGHPVPGVEVAISPLDADGAATGALTRAAGITGEVCVAAGHVKDRYDRLALTELTSSRDRGWHRSGDVGHLDAQGRIWIEGRLAHLITATAGTVTPVGIEQRVEAIEHIEMAAAVGVGPPGAQQVVVVVATDPAPTAWQLAPLSLIDRVRAAVPAVDVAAVLVVPKLPVDIRHQSKIDRALLAQEAAARLAGRGLGGRRRSGGRRDRAEPAADHADQAADPAADHADHGADPATGRAAEPAVDPVPGPGQRRPTTPGPAGERSDA